MILEHIVFVCTVLLAVVLPGALVLIRETVKLRRREIIQDLAAVFDVQNADAGYSLIPSFEFVKFRYFLPTGGGATFRQPKDFSHWAWLCGVIPFIVLVGSLSWFSFSVLLQATMPPNFEHLMGDTCKPAAGVTCAVPLWAYTVIAAFAGSYLLEVRALYRAINNFDLTPAFLIDSAITILTATIIGLGIEIFAADMLLADQPGPSTKAGIILLAFTAGYLPNAAPRWIMTKSRLSNFKRENNEIFKQFEATPIELIDGIDTQIRDHLADFHISSTQNLAAANPLMLFVETPYGVYQVMDWVAQAQLCTSVGPVSVTALWKLGVRTLFDLERAALTPECYNKQMLEAIGAAIFAGSQPLPTAANPGATVAYDEAFIRANIEMRLDDPHVQRLRQIYMQVSRRIGYEHLRFIARNGNTRTTGFRLSSGIAFTAPDTITDAEHGLGTFRVGDRIKVLGGANDGAVGTVVSLSRGLLKVEGATFASATPSGEIALTRLNP